MASVTFPGTTCSSPFWRVGTKTLPSRTQGAGATLLALQLPSSPTSQHRAVGLGEARQLLNAPKTYPESSSSSSLILF